LHFLLAWLHSILIERLRYIPIGYSKTYEFNEADQRCALDLVDEYVDTIAEGRTNVDPERIPWEAIRVTLTHNIYGGKIDNIYDQAILASLVRHLFTVKSFDPTYNLFPIIEGLDASQSQGQSHSRLLMPDANQQAEYVQWVEKLPNIESPAWCGLPLSVERIAKELQTQRVVNQLWSIQDLEEAEEVIMQQSQDVNHRPAKVFKQIDSQLEWLSLLEGRVQQFLGLLPNTVEVPKRSSSSVNDPLFRFLEREVTVANRILNLIKMNLFAVEAVC